MRKLLFISMVFALFLTMVLGTAIEAKSRLNFQGIYYSFDALPNEPAIWCDYLDSKDLVIAKGDDFIISHKLPDIATMEAVLYEKVQIGWFVKDEWLTKADGDEDWRYFLDPPVLLSDEVILETKQNKVLLRTYIVYFAIHIYSIDDIETSESELNFVTRFSNSPIIGEWW